LIMKGNLLRMTARGHKKNFSKKSEELVTSGPYSLVRNPMYLGSFLIGAGFVLEIWPWWCLPFFGWMFYMRFVRQVIKEEKVLNEQFGEKYAEYSKKVPRVFPSLKSLNKVKTNDIFNLNEMFSTNEKRGLAGWLALAVILETFQELLVFGITNITSTVVVFISTIIIFAIGFWVSYSGIICRKPTKTAQ